MHKYGIVKLFSTQACRRPILILNPLQLREHGQLGMPGALAQEHVTLMLRGLEQGAQVEGTHHAPDSLVKLAVAQV